MSGVVLDLTVEELEQLPPPRWLIRSHLVAESISVLDGPSGGGRTFVALDLALAIAAAGARPTAP